MSIGFVNPGYPQILAVTDGYVLVQNARIQVCGNDRLCRIDRGRANIASSIDLE